MPELVKTTLLQALEAALAKLPGLPTVRREFDLPFDLDSVTTPALFFWEDPEDLEEINLMARNVLHLSLGVFIKLTGDIGDGQTPAFQGFADAADIVAGQVHGLINNRENLAAWQALGLLELEPVAQSKALASETYGEMVLTYRLTYWHRLGDANSLNLS